MKEIIKKTISILTGIATLFSLLYLTKIEFSYDNTCSALRRVKQTRGKMELSEFKDKAIYVPVGKNDITNASHNKPFIYSEPAKDCVLVTLYCKSDRIGGIAHITIAQNPATELASFFEKFTHNGINIDNLEARIVGGDAKLSRQTVSQIINILTNNGIEIIENDTLKDGTYAIVMNVQDDGNIFDIIGF